MATEALEVICGFTINGGSLRIYCWFFWYKIYDGGNRKSSSHRALRSPNPGVKWCARVAATQNEFSSLIKNNKKNLLEFRNSPRDFTRNRALTLEHTIGLTMSMTLARNGNGYDISSLFFIGLREHLLKSIFILEMWIWLHVESKSTSKFGTIQSRFFFP